MKRKEAQETIRGIQQIFNKLFLFDNYFDKVIHLLFSRLSDKVIHKFIQ